MKIGQPERATQNRVIALGMQELLAGKAHLIAPEVTHA